MVVFSVEIEKFLVGQIRNTGRISAGFYPVRRIRKQTVENLTFQHLVRRGKGTFHLIIYHTVIAKRSILALQLIIPALLEKNLFSFINIRIEHRVQIDMHQVFKICIVAACHRIHGPVRIGHRIEERIQRSLDQFHKRIFQRKFPGTFQNTVFQDVCHSRAVCRRRAECNIEYFVFVIIFHQKYPRPAFFMAEQITSGMNVFDFFFFDQLICRAVFYFHTLSFLSLPVSVLSLSV